MRLTFRLIRFNEFKYKLFRLINSFKFHFYYDIFLKYIPRPDSKKAGYNIYGYFSKVIGQGEIARAFVDEMIKNREKFVLVDWFNLSHKKISRRERKRYSRYYYRRCIYDKNIFFVDLMSLHEIRKSNPSLFSNKINAVAFWWEFESGFEDRVAILNEFDEVYVFSDFIKNTLLSTSGRSYKIIKIAYPMSPNWQIEESAEAIRTKYNLGDKFCFFFNFDYMSSYNRKNPEAILHALAEEFPDDKRIVFVVKTNNCEGFRNKEEQFIQTINDLDLSERVTIIKEPLSRNGFMSLLNAMDCYVSLHRGEGLGLGILEALAMNKDVIATNYGGNTEYMHHPLAHAVDYSIVAAADDYAVYRNVTSWAEPSKAHARELMRKVVMNS